MAKTNNILKSNIIPKSHTDLGYYLAGLIEGDGHFSKKQLMPCLKKRSFLRASKRLCVF